MRCSPRWFFLFLLPLALACTSLVDTSSKCERIWFSGGSAPVAMLVGDSRQFSVMRSGEDFSSEGPGGCVTISDSPAQYLWQSTNDQIASVSAGGLVHAVSPGFATISATRPDFPFPAQQDVAVAAP
jgi:Big-like domain-containing protein